MLSIKSLLGIIRTEALYVGQNEPKDFPTYSARDLDYEKKDEPSVKFELSLVRTVDEKGKEHYSWIR